MAGVERLAIDGGTPVRDEKAKPWPRWPPLNEADWDARVAPALREVYVSGVEGLPCPRAEAFAERFAAYCGVRYGRTAVHGTDAITSGLVAALDLDAWGEGGEVIVPNYTFIATASAPLDCRCTIAFADIDPRTFTLDPRALEAAIVPGRTRAVIPVHLAGHPADMDAINDVASRHGLKVIEDCAQAHGARYTRGMVGSLGDVGAFSFQSSKNLTCGEGGVITTDDIDIDARALAFLDVGRVRRGARWDYARIGRNYRVSEYLVALLDVRLDDLEEQTEHRARMADALSARLEEIPGITPPYNAPWCERHAHHLYAILVDAARFGGRSREQVVEAVCAEGVPCMAGYTRPLSTAAGLEHFRSKYPDAVRVLPCPHTEHVCAHSTWLAQQMLLGNEQDMADIAAAFAKVQRVMAG